jgi:hypothetical protein
MLYSLDDVAALIAVNHYPANTRVFVRDGGGDRHTHCLVIEFVPNDTSLAPEEFGITIRRESDE